MRTAKKESAEILARGKSIEFIANIDLLAQWAPQA
jgi:hypothetical protein